MGRNFKKGLQIKLTDTEFRKLSEETGVSQFDIEKLYAMKLMQDSMILNYLIRHDFYAVKRLGRYKPSQIVTRIVMFYHVTRTRVIAALTSHNAASYYCEECGKIIRKCDYLRNEGLCDDCVAKSIELPQ